MTTTFDQDDTGLDSGNPIELYRFYGILGSYTYTSSNRQISFNAPSSTVGAEIYKPVPVSRSEITLGDPTEKNELKIMLPKGLSLIDDYVFDVAPNDDLILEIYRQHGNSGSVRQIFYGNVASFSVQENKVQVTCPSVFTNYMQSEFPNIYFQSPCNHTLFDAKCGLDRTLFQVGATITSISADGCTIQFNVDTLPTGNGTDTGDSGDRTFHGVDYNNADTLEWNRYLNDYPDIVPEANKQVILKNFVNREDYAAYHYVAIGMAEGRVVHPTPGVTTGDIMSDGWLVPGEIDTTHERRLILVHADGQIVINYKFRDLSVGDTVLMFAGCDRSSLQCLRKFNNGSNFFGFEYIPYINPFSTGIT